MKISKNMKKLMSSIMVMALAFSTVFIAQPVKADTTPKVEVVGATLRKDGGSGKQALRFAIKVSNADKANDCGITIIANGHTRTISIGKGQTNLYEKDDKNNTVTYTAAVTGIPAGYETENFEFSGFVKPIDGDPIPTGTVSKKMTDVASAAGYQINTSGDKIVATPQGGTLANKGNGNAGQISLEDENLRGKTVKISFEMRVEGATTDGVTMDFKTNYGGNNANNPSTPDNTIYNNWTPFSFQWNMPENMAGQPVLYLTESDGSSYDAETMEFYYQNFSVSVVYDNNAVEGTVVNRFNANDTLDTVLDPSLGPLGKNVAKLTVNNGYNNSGIVVKFELPDGEKLDNYDTLSVNINADKRGYKPMAIDWRNSGDTQTSFDNGTDAYRLCPTDGQRYKSNQGNEWKTETFTLDYDASGTDVTTKQERQTVYLGILYNAESNTNIKFADIILTKSK